MTPLETSSASIPTQAKLNARAGSKDLLNPTVEDIVAVGTDAILESPHISDGPGRIANAPVPSVFVSIESVCLKILFSFAQFSFSKYTMTFNYSEMIVVRLTV